MVQRKSRNNEQAYIICDRKMVENYTQIQMNISFVIDVFLWSNVNQQCGHCLLNQMQICCVNNEKNQ